MIAKKGGSELQRWKATNAMRAKMPTPNKDPLCFGVALLLDEGHSFLGRELVPNSALHWAFLRPTLDVRFGRSGYLFVMDGQGKLLVHPGLKGQNIAESKDEDGAFYIKEMLLRRDGETNPDNFVGHRRLLFAFARDVGALSAAYDLTREERFAVAAVAHLRAWLVDPATRMNPNLQYAQSIKGVCTGRGTGLIDTVHLAEVALGIRALHGSRALDGAT